MSDTVPSYKIINQLSKSIADQHECLELAVNLDLGRDEIRRVERSQERNISLLAFHVLSKWTEIFANKATGHVLVKALEDMGRHDLALETKQSLEDETKKASASSESYSPAAFSRPSGAPSQGTSRQDVALMKLFEQLSQNFPHYGICDSFATHLEVNSLEIDFVREYQQKNPDLRSNYPMIAKEILRHWNREVALARGWSVHQRLDVLYQVLSEELQRSDLAEKLQRLCERLFPQGTQ